MDMEVRLGAGMPGTVRATDRSATIATLLAERTMSMAPQISWDKRTNRFYLLVKRVVARPPDTKPPTVQEVVALDPGARKFNAFYRSDGLHGELLHGADGYIKRMCTKVARQQSLGDTAATPASRRKHRRRKLRASARLRNWTRNAHYESIKRLFTLGDFIILPIFESQRMSRRASRVFGNTTAQQLYTWSHYSFSQRLYSKAQVTANKNVAFTREPGTSKTCDCCGRVHGSLGGAHVFSCQCGYRVDRDYHGARGNYLAALNAAHNIMPDNVDL